MFSFVRLIILKSWLPPVCVRNYSYYIAKCAMQTPSQAISRVSHSGFQINRLLLVFMVRQAQEKPLTIVQQHQQTGLPCVSSTWL